MAYNTQRGKVRLDPVQYEIFYNRLEQEMFEAKEVVRHLSASTIVREAGEVAQVICLKNGDAALISAGLLVHVASLTRAIKYMIDNEYEKDIGFYDGDQFIANDPYTAGMHIPDMMMIAPFFYKGEHIGWVGNYTHVPEVGAIEPGGMCASATEFCHEGIRLPCVKLVERGVQRRDVMAIMSSAVRDPKTIVIDTRAKIAGNERAKKRLSLVIEEFGLDFFLAGLEQLIEDAAAFAQVKIKEFRPGKYRARTFTDSVSTFDQRLRVGELCMEITEEGKMILSGPVVSPQGMGYNNAALPGVQGLLFCVLLWQFFYEGRWNTGMLQHIDFDFPVGSMYNCIKAPVGYAPVGCGMQLQGCLNETLSRACYITGNYDDIMAPNSMLNSAVVGGMDRYGRPYGTYMISCMACGGGARINKDGQDSSVTQFNPWDDCGDVETEEAGPVMMFFRNHEKDSGGLGKYRGGVAAENMITPYGSAVTFVGMLGSGGYVSQVQGMYGGYPTPAGYLKLVKGSDIFERAIKMEPIPHSISEWDMVQGEHQDLFPAAAARQLFKGDLFAMKYWGGGGLGDPIERDTQAIVQDLKNELTRLETVEKVYCAKVDAKTLEVDLTATEKMRAAKRKERLSKGKPGKKYIQEMVERRRSRNLPEPVLMFFDELDRFSEGFKKELAVEEQFASSPDWKIEKKGVTTKLFTLTPYVDVVENAGGDKLAVCSECGQVLCRASENFKLYCLIYDRDPAEVYFVPNVPKKDWMIFREFYCPGCGVQMEVEGTPQGMTIVHSIEVRL